MSTHGHGASRGLSAVAIVLPVVGVVLLPQTSSQRREDFCRDVERLSLKAHHSCINTENALVVFSI